MSDADRMRGPDWTHGSVTTPDEYRALQRRTLAANAAKFPGRYSGLLVRPAPEGEIAAYVNHGRWLVDCTCHNGVSTHPAWRIACCMSCGRVWERVVFPEDADAICAELLQRSEEHQNWRPGETADDLRRERERHEGRR